MLIGLLKFAFRQVPFVGPRVHRPHVITLRLSDDELNALKELKATSELSSYSEVIRTALALYYALLKELEAGAQIIIERNRPSDETGPSEETDERLVLKV